MVKIIFSNGESVEWNEGNLPDSISINFDSEPQPPVPDRISADHIDSLANMLEYMVRLFNESKFKITNQDKYWEAIHYGRERAKWLREGKA